MISSEEDLVKLKAFMNEASFSEKEVEIPPFSIYTNQLKLYKFPISNPLFSLIKERVYISDIEPKILKLKRSRIYKELFSDDSFQTSVNKYLAQFPMGGTTYPELTKVRLLSELSFFYCLHYRDLYGEDGIEFNFQAIVKKARDDIEKTIMSLHALKNVMRLSNYSILELSKESELITSNITALETKLSEKQGILALIPRTQNKVQADRMLLTRIAYNLFFNYGSTFEDYAEYALELSKPALNKKDITLIAVQKYLSEIPELLQR